MESIEITTSFDQKGNIKPLRFTWREREYRSISVGRSWQDETGRHILVMAPGNQVYELVYSASEMRWYLAGIGLDQKAA